MTKEEWDRARLRRQDQIRRDHARLSSPSTRLVGFEIFANSNFKTGTSWHSQETMAQSLGICLRTIKRALPPLIAAGYIRVKKVWKNNIYEIVLDEKSGVNLSPDKPKATTASGDKIVGIRGQNRPNSGDKNAPITLPSNSTKNSLSGDGDGDGAEAPPQIDPKFKELCRKILIAVRAVPEGPLSLEAPRIVQNWRRQGWHDDVILAGVKVGMRSVPSGAPNTLRYFDQPIARLHDDLSRPLGPVELARKKKPDPKTGTYEVALAAEIGWDCLQALPEARREDLCTRWGAGHVPPSELEALKLECKVPAAAYAAIAARRP